MFLHLEVHVDSSDSDDEEVLAQPRRPILPLHAVPDLAESAGGKRLRAIRQKFLQNIAENMAEGDFSGQIPNTLYMALTDFAFTGSIRSAAHK